MDFAQLKELIQIFEKSGLTEMEIEHDKSKIKLSKNGQVINKIIKSEANLEHERLFSENPDVPITIVPEVKTEKIDGIIVKSPIVGTFYLNPSPTLPPFIKIGDNIKVGDVICIIEAMKVMNEIKAKESGTIAEILVENEAMVEYNQPLLRLV